jgi:putative nucleotidyltransferase with HDIG domain
VTKQLPEGPGVIITAGKSRVSTLSGEKFRNVFHIRQYQEYDAIVAASFNKLAYQQPFTAQHALGVNRISMEIAEQMNCFDELSLVHLHWGTLLHDIGKLAVSTEVLLKPAGLSLAEYETICEHPVIGAQLLSDKLPEEVLDIVRCHHERYDGEGYPNRIAGKSIPMLAKICSVADAFEAMTADKPYRKALNIQQAADELFWNSGTQFDPAVIEIFLKWDLARTKIAI